MSVIIVYGYHNRLVFASADASLNGTRTSHIYARPPSAPVADAATSATAAAAAVTKPTLFYDVTRADGLRVTIMKADITTVKADVIVNAANETLHHISTCW